MLSLFSCRLFTATAQHSPVICFTFDDQHLGVYTNALPIMAEYEFRGTCFVNTNELGKPENLSIALLQELHNSWNWEIGGHTLNHEQLPYLEYNEAEIAIAEDYWNLKNWNLNPQSFALPRGECPAEYFSIINRYYTNIRGSSDFSMFIPINPKSLGYLAFQSNWSAEIIKERIRRGIANSERLIIIGFHQIGAENSEYVSNCPVSTFSDIMSWTNSMGLQVLPLSEAVKQLK
ncbi:MAG: polysaccharide deacetylase family protein [Candidatus Cloacimonetes bacterium]|nr:polysaccharide deacetylase family protein [Candidatus Cloacimonadota bacterium]